MRLIERNSAGELSLTEDFIDDDIPEYAILSHTWGKDREEVNFKDLTEGSGKEKAGYRKILFCGEQAARDGLRYWWVDTCCIDKSNNTELSEAFNSMFKWYEKATKCYVYLSDVSTNDHNQLDLSLQTWQSSFRKSRWFTRGWTLQELIAPRSVEFFCSNSKRLGDKQSLLRQLYEITGIAVPALRGTTLSAFSVEERMSWANKRVTRREEDKFYSLLGLFDIHMPLIYGEGAENAFRTLREEVDKHQRKRQLDELSTVSETTFSSTKRLKTPRSQLSSVPLHRETDFLDPEPLFSSEYSVDSIDATTIQSLIDQLYFTKIDERVTSLTAAQSTTCRWFLTKPEYTSWHNVAQQPEHGGFLWIKEAKANAEGDPSQITLSFFFQARSTDEEKSTTGLYRSLLHQLFQKENDLRDSLKWMTADGARVVQRDGWREEALKQTLAKAIQMLGSRSLTIFVDALDECNKNQAEGMIDFFEELSDGAREAQVRLHICFSSRHYPTIVIKKGIEVTLEDEIGHKEDIKQYIKSKLKKSSKIFLWVVLVIDILNSEYRNGSAFTKIREHLRKIPSKLADLFELILGRDIEDLERLQACLKWILFATRPLKPQELYFAIQLALDKECSGFWDQEDVDLNQIKTFVRSSSKGLAEVTRNNVVQFIHESVRDFLLGKYEGQWSGVSGNFVGRSHEILKDCCLARINASIGQGPDIANLVPQAPKAAQLREAISLKCPFLEYSVGNVLCHANGAQQNAVEQGEFLASFPLQQWIFLNNAFERYDIRRYTESASLLYILAERNLADLIRIHPQRESCFDVENERYGLPMFAALATGSDQAVRTFLEVQFESQSSTSSLDSLLKRYCPTSFGYDFNFAERKPIDCCLAENGNEVVLAFYLEKHFKVESKNIDGRTPLSCAAQYGHEAIVKLLLTREGLNAASKDNGGWTPLSWAARNGQKAIVELLLAREGVDADSKDNSGRTPLSYAARYGHKAIVELLTTRLEG